MTDFPIPVPRLRHIRRLRSFSQRELATASGVSHSTIVRAEAGRIGLRPVTVRRLAETLHVSPASLQGLPDLADKSVEPLKRLKRDQFVTPL